MHETVGEWDTELRGVCADRAALRPDGLVPGDDQATAAGTAVARTVGAALCTCRPMFTSGDCFIRGSGGDDTNPAGQQYGHGQHARRYC